MSANLRKLRDTLTFLKKEKGHWLAVGAFLLLLLAFLLVSGEGGIDPFNYEGLPARDALGPP